MSGLKQRRRWLDLTHRGNVRFALLAGPGAVFILIALLFPLMSIVVFSFWRTESYELYMDWNLDNYATLLGEAAYRTFFLRSFVTAAIVTAICLVCGWPIAYFIARYGDILGRSCWQDFARKRLDRDRIERLNDRLAGCWPEIAERIAAISLSPDYLSRVLKAAGAPVTPQEVHLPRPFYEEALLRCREIRDRFTFLDLAASCGRLQPSLAAL